MVGDAPRHTTVSYTHLKKGQAPIKPLDNEYVLGLLAGANKPEKAVDIKQFEKLTLYLTDLKYARYASTLRYATIIASGKNYIVVAVENVAEANAINEADRENEYYDLIVELLGKNKKLFAVSKQQQQQVIQEFKERMIQGTLPDPIMVEDVVIDTTKDKEPCLLYTSPFDKTEKLQLPYVRAMSWLV